MSIAHDGRNEQTGTCNRENNNSFLLVKQERATNKAKAIDAMSTNKRRANACPSNSENIKSNTAYSRIPSRARVSSESSRASTLRDETPSSSIYRDNLGENVDVDSANEKRPQEIQMRRPNGRHAIVSDKPTAVKNYLSHSNVGEKEQSGQTKVNTNLFAVESHLQDAHRKSLKLYKHPRRTRAFSWKKYDGEDTQASIPRKIKKDAQISDLNGTNASVEKNTHVFATNDGGCRQIGLEKNKTTKNENTLLLENGNNLLKKTNGIPYHNHTTEITEIPLEPKINFPNKSYKSLNSVDPFKDFGKKAFYQTRTHKINLDSIKTPLSSIETLKTDNCDRRTARTESENATYFPLPKAVSTNNNNSSKAPNIKNKSSRFYMKSRKTNNGSNSERRSHANNADRDITFANPLDLDKTQNDNCFSQQSAPDKVHRDLSIASVQPENNANKSCISNEKAILICSSPSKPGVLLNNRQHNRKNHHKKGLDTSETLRSLGCHQFYTTSTRSKTSCPKFSSNGRDKFHPNLNTANALAGNRENNITIDKTKYIFKDLEEAANFPLENGIIKIPPRQVDSRSKNSNRSRVHRRDRQLKQESNCTLKVLVDDSDSFKFKSNGMSSASGTMSRDSLEKNTDNTRGNNRRCEGSNTRAEIFSSWKKEVQVQISDYFLKGDLMNTRGTDSSSRNMLIPGETSVQKSSNKNNLMERIYHETNRCGMQDNNFMINQNVPIKKSKNKRNVRMCIKPNNVENNLKTLGKAKYTSDDENGNCKVNVLPIDLQSSEQKLSECLALSAESRLESIKHAQENSSEYFGNHFSPDNKKQSVQPSQEYISYPHSNTTPPCPVKSILNMHLTNVQTKTCDLPTAEKLQRTYDSSGAYGINHEEIIKYRRMGKFPPHSEHFGIPTQSGTGCIKPLHIIKETNNASAAWNDSRSSSPFTMECARQRGEFQPPELYTRPVLSVAAKISPTINSGRHARRNSQPDVHSEIVPDSRVVNDTHLKSNHNLHERFARPSRKYSYPRIDRTTKSKTNQLIWLKMPPFKKNGFRDSATGEEHFRKSDVIKTKDVVKLPPKDANKTVNSTTSEISLKFSKNSLNIPEEIKSTALMSGTEIDCIKDENKITNDWKSPENDLLRALTRSYPHSSKFINPPAIPLGKRGRAKPNQIVQCYLADSPLDSTILKDKCSNFSYARTTTNKESEGARFDAAFADNLHTSSEMTFTRDHTPPQYSSKTSDSQGSPHKTPVLATTVEANEEWSHPQRNENHQFHPRIPEENLQGESLKHENTDINPPQIPFTSSTPTTKREKLAQGKGLETETSTVTRSYTDSVESVNGKSQSRVFVNYRKKVTFTDNSDSEKEAASDCNKSKQTPCGFFGWGKPEQSASKSDSKKNTFRGFFSRSNKVASASSASGALNEWPNNHLGTAHPKKIEGKFPPRNPSVETAGKVEGRSCKSNQSAIAGGGLKETLWGITQVNVFNDGSKTFELRKPARKKPWWVPEEIENIFVLPAPKI